MRRASVFTLAGLLVGGTAFAAPPGSAESTLNVSVEVVRACTVSSGSGQTGVTCTTGAAARPDPNAPAPLVSAPVNSGAASDGLTVNF